MAVWKGTVAGCQVVIHTVDHLPPHCHVFIEGRDVRVGLEDMDRMSRNSPRLSPALRRGLSGLREELLEAWNLVVIIGKVRDV